MVSLTGTLRASFEDLYASGDPGFADVLAQAEDAADDEAVAELIELDGRARIARGLPVSLQRYLDGVPGLDRRPVALDSAIDVALRSLSGGSRLADGAVESLARQHPSLASAIREAALLSEALWSTTGLRARFKPTSRRETPCDFGPRLGSGRPRYELRRPLGAGAGGEVYLAVDRQLSEPDHPAFVAIKLLHASDNDPWARRRLVDEATKARRVTHPNVARVLDLGITEEDDDFVVYELVSGGDLAAWHAMHPTADSLRARVGLVSRIARGVQAAHAVGLVHCDLKPGNILVSAADEPKVTDFGIAVRAGEPRRDIPDYDADRPVGNLAFISPEQYRAEDGSLSIPSDLYALGGILFYLITGELPNGKTLDEVRRNHDPARGRRTPPSARAANPRLDRTLDAICRRAMALRPEDRYSSAGALADDLDAWLRREPIAWTKPSVALRTRLWATRRPGTAGVLVAAVLMVAVGAGFAAKGWTLAAQRREEAAIEKAKVDAVRARMQVMYDGVIKSRANRLSHDLLPAIMAMEWVEGDTVLGNAFERPQLWAERIRTVRAIIDAETSAGRGDQFAPLLWKSALGLWLTNDGNYAEAEPVLDEALAGWRARLQPTDRWLAQLSLIRDAASVKRLAARAGQLTDAERAELEPLAARLTVGEKTFEDQHDSPVHRAVAVAIAELTGPSLLNRPDDRARYEAVVKAIDQ